MSSSSSRLSEDFRKKKKEGNQVNGFVHLHSHTDKSIRDAVMKVKDYVKKVKELGMTACAITEHGNMHSALEFYNACKEEGIKPIIGVEAYVIPTREMAFSDGEEKHTKYHLTLLVKDEIGYKQLIKAVTKSQLLKDKKAYPRMTYEDLSTFFVGGHVIALSGCVQGEIPVLLLKGEYEEAKKKALFYQSIFGKGNFFIELQNHNLPQELAVLPQLIRIGQETGIPLVATNDCHYIAKKDARAREMVVAMKFNKKITDPDFERDCQELYVKSPEEMWELFKEVPEALTNTLTIAEQCEIEFKKEKHFPKFKTPDGYTEAEYLRKLAEEGLYKRFPDFDSWPEEEKKKVRQRLEYELQTIIDLHYEGYLLIVQDFIQYGKKIGMVGPGRGSAVGSLVSYLIGITDVNPLRYNLLFERFLNKDRVSDPDIDTDFDECRDEVIKYVKSVYGENSVCNIVTFGTMAARAAIRSAGRVTGKPLELCDRIAKMIPQKPGITLAEVLGFVEPKDEDSDYRNPELINEYNTNPQVKELIDDAMLLEGLVMQTGVHAAGVIIADRDVSDYIPLLYEEEDDMWITQFDKDVCEADAGLLKMDFLGLENLTIIKRTLADIERNHGVKLTLADIPLDDQNVIREIFCKGRTKAVFQFESSGMVNLLKRFQPSSIDDLILLNAAYRPGPIQYINDIIEVKHGRKKPYYICPEMEKIIGITYGKPIYQEQIMQIFHDIAGFTLGEADIIRRAMAKKKTKELEQYLPKFKDALIAKGVKVEDAEKFCEELMEFSKYAFNKSHSAAYAIIAYYTAYLKYYYPVEYMANVLTSSSTKKLPLYIKECKDMGIPVLPPSINKSGKYFTPSKDGTIYFGLAGVKNVGKACEGILAEREKGEFKSFRDFIERMVQSDPKAVNKKVIESLILTGTFDEFGMKRRQMMEGFESYVKDLKDYLRKKENPKTKPQTLEKAKQKVEAPHFDETLPEYDRNELLQKEKELIGFYASGHPLQEYQSTIDEKADIMIGSIDEDLNGQIVTLVGQIHDLKPLYRKSDGAPMCKFVLEDMTGEINAVCFTKAYAEWGKNIAEGEVVILRGKIMVETDPVTSEVIDMQINVSEVRPARERKVYVKIPSVFEFSKAKEVLKDFRGANQLYVFLENEQKMYRTKIFVSAVPEMKTAIEKLFGEGSVAII